MNIRGIYKTSLIDYPGRICTVLFCGGCNLRCRFCHNPDLACNKPHLERTTNEEALAFLHKRRGLIDGVTISGGEPTISKNIMQFISKVKNFSLEVKLDTNGLNPAAVEALVKDNLLDYAAVDVKTSPEKYEELAGQRIDFRNIIETIDILKNSGIDYELRTTCIPSYVTIDDLARIGKLVGRVKRYYLQQFTTHVPLLDQTIQMLEPYPVNILHEFRECVSSFSDFTDIRGI